MITKENINKFDSLVLSVQYSFTNSEGERKDFCSVNLTGTSFYKVGGLRFKDLVSEFFGNILFVPKTETFLSELSEKSHSVIGLLFWAYNDLSYLIMLDDEVKINEPVVHTCHLDDGSCLELSCQFCNIKLKSGSAEEQPA